MTTTSLVKSAYMQIRCPRGVLRTIRSCEGSKPVPFHLRFHRRQLSSSVRISDNNRLALPKSASTHVSKEDVRNEETKRWRLSEVLISQVLEAKNGVMWVEPVIDETATVIEAIVFAADGNLSGMMVVNDEGHIVGLITSRDLLRIVAAGAKADDDHDRIMTRTIKECVTPFSQVVYARPNETIGVCRTIMAKLGIKVLPVLSDEGKVEGIVTAKDMSEYGISAKDKGGKKSYLNDVSERVGLSSNTSMAEPPAFLMTHLALEKSPLFVNVGVSELPHPFKTDGAVGMSHRDFGPSDFATDASLSEDAYFVSTAKFPDGKNGEVRRLTYMGVADGVGSWREYGVDPRDFSHSLMAECENVIMETSADASASTNDKKKSRQSISPGEVLAQAFDRVKEKNIIGSCTACVAVFDGIRHQLHFSNLGDSGIIILRHIDSDIAGTLKRDRSTPRIDRKSDLRVAFVSQQQLKSFNHPFQLGWTGHDAPDDEENSFKSAKDSCTTSIHLRHGDIIIMATDGLFDNVDVDDITSLALEWERKHGFIQYIDSPSDKMADISAVEVQDFAATLVQTARENSLDKTLDSPFAILAKENDIMWSGGMPDDCTVVVMHVVSRSSLD